MHGHVSSQNNRYWGSVNPRLIHEVPLHDVIVGVWCVMNAKLINGPTSYAETILIGMMPIKTIQCVYVFRDITFSTSYFIIFMERYLTRIRKIT
jgi:hypothetical protein